MAEAEQTGNTKFAALPRRHVGRAISHFHVSRATCVSTALVLCRHGPALLGRQCESRVRGAAKPLVLWAVPIRRMT
jgi:hypothetical protein